MATEHDVQALRSILSKLEGAEQAEDASNDGHQAKQISEETLKGIAERLRTFVGEDFVMPTQPAVDEEGLPILEFTEPVTDYRPSEFIPPPPKLVPMPTTEEGKVAFRKARDAFLDALEEEEARDEERTRRAEESEFMRVVRVAKERVEETRTEINTRSNAESVGSIPEVTTRALPAPEEQVKATSTKKTVSFAEAEEGSDFKDRTAPVWGSLQQGRLRTGVKSGSVMKLQIVERTPSHPDGHATTGKIDSDDEDSEDEGKVVGALERSTDAAVDDITDPETKLLPSSDEESNRDESDGHDEVDIDEAIHHREVALRYHELRHSLGKGPLSGALGGPVESTTADDEWEQEDVPLEAHLRDEPREIRSSKFMQSKLSQRAMTAVLPKGLQGEVKYGRVADDQLVQDNGESDDELNHRGKRIVEGLTKGLTVEEILANEPSSTTPGQTLLVEQEQPERKPPNIKAGTAILGDVVESSTRNKPQPSPAGKPVKVSRFKANRLT